MVKTKPKPSINFLKIVEAVDRCYKLRFKEDKPSGLFGHVTDEFYELDRAFMAYETVSKEEKHNLKKYRGELLDEGWDLVFMVYGFMRGVATQKRVLDSLNRVIVKNSKKIKDWDIKQWKKQLGEELEK